MAKRRKPVRGWRKIDGAWRLRVGKLVLWTIPPDEVTIDSYVAEHAKDLVDAERRSLVAIKDAWQRLAKKVAEREGA